MHQGTLEKESGGHGDHLGMIEEISAGILPTGVVGEPFDPLQGIQPFLFGVDLPRAIQCRLAARPSFLLFFLEHRDLPEEAFSQPRPDVVLIGLDQFPRETIDGGYLEGGIVVEAGLDLVAGRVGVGDDGDLLATETQGLDAFLAELLQCRDQGPGLSGTRAGEEEEAFGTRWIAVGEDLFVDRNGVPGESFMGLASIRWILAMDGMGLRL